MIIQLLDMSDNTYFTYQLYYEKRNILLDEAKELIDQIQSTDEIDEKIKIFDKINKNIKKYNETNNKSVKIHERLNPEEKIVFQEERTNHNKRFCLFNTQMRNINEELLKIILDECEKLIRQYYLTNKISIKNKICDELNEKIRKYWTFDLPSRNKFKDRFELICKKWDNIKREIKTFDVKINGIIYMCQNGNVFDKKTNEFVGTYDSETNVFEMYEDEEEEDSNEEEDSDEEEKDSDEEEDLDEEEYDSDEEQVEIINEQLFEEDEQISSFILDHTEQYNIHLIYSLCEDVMESCIIINELLNKINN